MSTPTPADFGRPFRVQNFPHLDPAVTFINHGSYGVVPKQVKDAQLALLAEYDADPDKFRRMRVEDLWIEVSKELAEYFGTDDGNIALVESTTSGINSILKSVPLGVGDCILFNTWTHPMTKNAIKDRVSKQNLCPVELQYPYPITSEDAVIEWYKEAFVLYPRIKLVVIDMISSTPNLQYPLDRLIPLCQEKGAMVLIDAAHGVGQVKFQLRDLKPDFLAGSCHKWMYTARGCGVVYVDPKHHDVIKPLMASFEFDRPFYRCFIQQGCRDECPMIEARASLDFVDWIGGNKGWDKGLLKIHAYVSSLVTRNATMLASAFETEILKIPSEMESPFIRCIRLPEFPSYGKNADDAALLLTDIREQYKIWATVFFMEDDGEPELYLRICGQIYLEDADFVLLKDAILAFTIVPLQLARAQATRPRIHVGEVCGIIDVHMGPKHRKVVPT